MPKDKQLRLSPSSINLFIDCPRCFWLQFNKGIKRPAGIFPSLPGGMDIIIKKYFDSFRAKGKLPPELEGKVEGKLLDDLDLMKQWRNWRSGLSFVDGEVKLGGALDDCLVNGDAYVPVDYKTRGFDLKEDSSAIYENQLATYNLLLERNGYKQSGAAYLVYYIPKEVAGAGKINFKIEVVEMNADPEKAYKVFRAAVKCLDGPEPAAGDTCNYCGYRK